jgi:predicted membrane channel-forming protein YqfA (hemolysin III family)
MALSWKARRRWALFALLIAMPLYVVVAVNIMDLFDRPPFLLELVIYVVLGIVWALPLKKLFKGIGQPDPDAPADQSR